MHRDLEHVCIVTAGYVQLAFPYQYSFPSLCMFCYCRLMHTCLSHSTLAQSWTNTLGVREVKDQLLFILHSSTHGELIILNAV